MSDKPDEQPIDPLAPKGLENAFKVIGRQAENYKKAMQVMQGRKNVEKGKEEFPPTKFCPICRIMHSPSGIIGDTSLGPKVCETCQVELDGGAIAVYSPDRRCAFLHSASLVGVRNQVEVTNEQMDAIAARMKEI